MADQLRLHVRDSNGSGSFTLEQTLLGTQPEVLLRFDEDDNGELVFDLSLYELGSDAETLRNVGEVLQVLGEQLQSEQAAALLAGALDEQA